MSISAGQNKCGQFISPLLSPTRDLAERLSNTFETQNIVTTNLSIEGLATVASFLSPQEKILIVWPKPTKREADTFSKVSEALGIPRIWSVITDELADQEISNDVVTTQSIAYHELLSDKPSAHIVSTSVLHKTIPDIAAYRGQVVSVTQGETISVSEFTEHLIKLGYTRHRKSLASGSFRVMGEAVSLQHPTWNFFVTLNFSGNTIERIAITQNSRVKTTPRIAIPPMRFPEKSEHWQAIASQALVIRSHTSTLEGKKTLVIDDVQSSLTFSTEAASAAQALAKCLVPKEETSFEKPLTYEQAFELIGALQVGKPAVHADHGIGIFEGLQSRTISGQTKEYLVLRYAAGDAVSVPVEYAHKVTPYVGDTHPPIHRLHGTVWKKARQAAQVDAIAFAKELLAIAGNRSQAARQPYILSETVEDELTKTFPHDLTDDQVRTWLEVRDDMQKSMPIDRLVVGDVGFGKTEIAYRAARHAIANGKQVAVLAPTTLLVQQHYDLFSQRLPKSAGSVHLLSRFTDASEQQKAKEAAASGKPAIIVGTHALLSPKMQWGNLALVVIDEEQRFGVQQKEQLKKIRSAVDVLSLSATPIPRTLSMALSGLRALSLIATAPVGRKSVESFVGKLSEERLKKAIQIELERGGQVYVVAPKIRQLASIERKVKVLFPDTTTAIAHGRLSDEQLSSIVHRFDSGEVKILISSSIVEHGLDLPGANTMIVFYAPHFGLSDLYQLRGRIGRRATQGYAYFFYDQHELTPIQRERLTALTEASRLGSGWELARRDLEIRGAGNMLGAAQHGSVNAVGVQLYLDMVRQATSGEAAERNRADVALPFTSLLPVSYIEDADQRTAWYIRLTRAQTKQELEKRAKELEKQFGHLPPETENLLTTLRLQQVATAAGIQKIHTEKISPPDEDPYDRIIIDTKNAPIVLTKLSTLGNWRVRGSSLTWDVDEVNTLLIEKIILALST